MVNAVIAIFAGAFVGSIVNITLVNLGVVFVPLPEGASVDSVEDLAKTMHLMKPINFLFPYLGHAIGTLVGAFAGTKIFHYLNKRQAANAASEEASTEGDSKVDLSEGQLSPYVVGMSVGVLFLMGGISAIVMLGGPMWFNALDAITAYLPMGFLGTLLGGSKRTPLAN